MALDERDVALIEQLIYKCGDDIKSNVERSFERVHERISDSEKRISSLVLEMDDKLDGNQLGIIDVLEALREEHRSVLRF
jgi:hypothetical protein